MNITATARRLAAVGLAALTLWGVGTAALAEDEAVAPAAVVDGGATPDVINDLGPRNNRGVVYH